MTKAQTQILELFETLGEQERREIAEQLYAATERRSFLQRMSPAQKAELAESIAEADRGEGLPMDEMVRELAQKYGLKHRP